MSGYRGRGRGRGSGNNSSRGSGATGLFVNGVWHCDCNPRQPAVHFETKKQGPNKGRWFRSCQKQDSGRCGFFLWDSDAQPRELAALSINSRSEPDLINPKTLSKTPSKDQPSPPPSRSIKNDLSRKRTRSTSETLDEDYGLGRVDDDFREELDHVMTEIETPSKAVKTAHFATPVTSRRKLPWQMDQTTTRTSSGLQTPQTDRRTLEDPFIFRDSAQRSSLFTPTKFGDDDSHRVATPSSSYETPMAIRSKNVEPESLLQDVLVLLQEANVHLSTTTQNDLKSLLAKHAKNAEGYKRSRDVLRTTLKARDAKITELEYRIRTLEAEAEAEKAAMTHMQWEAQDEASDT